MAAPPTVGNLESTLNPPRSPSDASTSALAEGGETSQKDYQVSSKMGGDEYGTLASLPAARKVVLLIFLCVAQFLDTYANSSLFAAIPPISVQLGISNANSVWLISGYQLTFASFLLVVRVFRAALGSRATTVY